MDEWMDAMLKGSTWSPRLWVVLGRGAPASVWSQVWQLRPQESISCPCPGWGVCSTLTSTMQLTANTLDPGRQILESQTALSSLTRKSDRSFHPPVAGFRILDTVFPISSQAHLLLWFLCVAKCYTHKSSTLSEGFTVSCDLFWTASSWKIASTQ